ncbi:F0F1 ATP synthase subunit A [soil metagenome]
MILGLEFPPISHTIEWPDLFGSGFWAVNKVVLLMWISVALVFGFFLLAGRRRALVPTGVQNVAESTVDFVRNSIILQTMGPDGLGWTPFLLTLFSFVFVTNVWEIIPGAQMPVNARIAVPALLAVLVWVLYNFVGVKSQGFFGYLKSSVIPPGVPKAILPLVALIELVQLVIVRPFSLAVRLFANMLAGHLLLISFAVITTALFEATVVGAVLPLGMLIALTGFELLVAFLQAFIFAILTAVYIGGSMHPEH